MAASLRWRKTIHEKHIAVHFGIAKKEVNN